MDALFIEGKAVDLGGNAVALEYVNNLLSDISKISSSHSYTITLPLTANNSRIFDLAEDVAHKSSKVGKYLAAEYRRNGVTITKGARAYVTAANPSGISVCLIWDDFAALTDWLKGSAKLSDITFPAYTWNGTADYADYASINDVAVIKYNAGVDDTEMPPTPSVRASYIVSRMMAAAGIPYDLGDADFSGFYIPTCKRIGTRVPNAGGTYSGWRIDAPAAGETIRYIKPTTRTSGTMAVESSGRINVAAADAGKVEIAVDLTLSSTFEVFDAGVAFVMELVGVTASNEQSVLRRFASLDYMSRTSRTISGSATLTDLAGIQYIYMRVSGVRTSGNYYNATGTLSVIPTRNTAVVGEPYDIASNLPDMSQVEFLKALCALCGVQPIPQDGTLVFASVDSLYAAQGYALDWSGNVVNYDAVPTEVVFKIGEWAQRNRFKYTADEENEGINADGVLTVADRTLAYERDAVVLPFAASRDGVIAHYVLDNNGNVTDKEVKPRICTASADSSGKAVLRFIVGYEMGWPHLISANYSGMVGLLSSPRQIKVYLRLSEYDLAGINWLLPVYLAQTGQYYIVTKITTDTDGDICEATLIQMNN